VFRIQIKIEKLYIEYLKCKSMVSGSPAFRPMEVQDTMVWQCVEDDAIQLMTAKEQTRT
jgi:hypothetical protein